MKLIVALLTYNHRLFIEHALERLLCQEMDGEWEVVIDDEASSDGTTAILSSAARIEYCCR